MPSVYAGCPSARHQEAKITLLSPQLLAAKQKALGRDASRKQQGRHTERLAVTWQSEPRGLEAPQAGSQPLCTFLHRQLHSQGSWGQCSGVLPSRILTVSTQCGKMCLIANVIINHLYLLMC